MTILVATETAKHSHQETGLVQKIEKRITDITENSRKTAFVFQRLCTVMQSHTWALSIRSEHCGSKGLPQSKGEGYCQMSSWR